MTTDELPSYTVGRDADWYLIPESMRDSVRRYIEHGIPPGGFLTALLSNDLCETFRRADDNNRDNIFSFLRFLWNYAPSHCWGSPERYEAWIRRGGSQADIEALKASTEIGGA